MTHPRTTSRSRQARRGITLVEVVLALLLLSLTVGVVTQASSAILGMEAEGRKRLEGYEVANRLLLQYLDDERALPSDTLPITYGDHKYFWCLDTTPSRMVINKRQEASGANLQATDRFTLIGVTVFDCEHTENFEARGEPIAFLSRVIDPYAPRNPDTLETFNDHAKLEDFFKGLFGQKSGVMKNASLQGRQLR